MPSTVSQSNPANKAAFPLAGLSAAEFNLRPISRSGNSQVSALSIEFVARPHEAHRAQSAIPPALAGAFKEVTGFAGCLVMVSDQEARLVTVVTLWTGNERVKCCRENVRWVNALLAPYLDRRIRVQTMVAHLPVIRPGMNATSECFEMQNLPSEDETACVA